LLLSMTGHGESRIQEDGVAVAVELRTINSRFLKVTIRSSEGYAALEPQAEALLRKLLRRGTIQASFRVHRLIPDEEYQVNAQVLDAYRRQLETLRQQWNLPGSLSLEALLALPGVVDEDVRGRRDPAVDWPLVQRALTAAVENLDRMRAEEGRYMAADMQANCQAIAGCLSQIRQRVPVVVDNYRTRLAERVRKAMEEFQVNLEPADLVREVCLFAERSDIAEETVRLASHLEQFQSIADLPESSGRKLEFVIQEMLRETNTIGSKSYDVEIARLVIEIKTAIERLREMIQNVE